MRLKKNKKNMILIPKNLFVQNLMENFLTLASIYNGKITLEEGKKDQYKMLKQLEHLGEYDKKNLHKINSKKETLINAKKLCNNR